MYRIGQSTDIHRFVSSRPLVVGGIHIPHAYGLLGHSDADVLLHAITEALLGALGCGDIGTLFPDTDETYKDCSSLFFLKQSARLLKKQHWHIGNIDTLIIADEPSMAPYIPKMRACIAPALHIDESCINIKATRGESVLFTEPAMAAQAIVFLQKNTT